MFYVKENLNESMNIAIEISDKNAYCRCPKCGVEVPVDLSAFQGNEDFDIFSSNVYCDACTKAQLKGGPHESV